MLHPVFKYEHVRSWCGTVAFLCTPLIGFSCVKLWHYPWSLHAPRF